MSAAPNNFQPITGVPTTSAEPQVSATLSQDHLSHAQRNDEGPSVSAAPNDFQPITGVPTTTAEPQASVTLSQDHLSDVDNTEPSLEADSSPGRVRFYGPTTNLHIQSHQEQPGGNESTMVDDSNTGANENHNDFNVSSILSGFAINMDSTQLRETLLQSIWPFYARSVRVVDEHLFMAHRAVGQRSQYFSNFLEASLLACATRNSTSPAVRKLGRAYADRAKQDLALELEQPNIATLQGCLILSDFEATSARDRVGWIYSGKKESPQISTQRLTSLTRHCFSTGL